MRERLIEDLEQPGSVLPQQLKVVLVGLAALRQLSVAAYERVGALEGLEARFVESGVNAGTTASGLNARAVLALLLALIDREQRRKTPALTAGRLAAAIMPPLCSHGGYSNEGARSA